MHFTVNKLYCQPRKPPNPAVSAGSGVAFRRLSRPLIEDNLRVRIRRDQEGDP